MHLHAISSDPEGRIHVSLSPHDLAPLPTTVVTLLGIANEPDVSFDHLDEVISRDQALTLRVLTVANSSYYGCSRKIDAVRTAIAVLGTRQIQNIASAMALAPAFDSTYGPELWAHGLATALWTRHVMHALKIPTIDYLFTAALMHDIGIVLMIRSAADQEHACLLAAVTDERPLIELERERLGTDHAQLGAAACVAWQLPSRIINLVGAHHEPPPQQPGDAVDRTVLWLAEILAERCGNGEIHTDAEPQWPETTLASLGLDSAAMDTLLALQDEVAAEAGSFG